jgi:hypothetical protein
MSILGAIEFPRLRRTAMPPTLDPAIKKMVAKHKAVWAITPAGKTEVLTQPRPKKLLVAANGKPITQRAKPNPSVARDYRAEFVAHLVGEETFVPHLYLDDSK